MEPKLPETLVDGPDPRICGVNACTDAAVSMLSATPPAVHPRAASDFLLDSTAPRPRGRKATYLPSRAGLRGGVGLRWKAGFGVPDAVLQRPILLVTRQPCFHFEVERVWGSPR
jgi:hypothetical protein